MSDHGVACLVVIYKSHMSAKYPTRLMLNFVLLLWERVQVEEHVTVLPCVPPPRCTRTLPSAPDLRHPKPCPRSDDVSHICKQDAARRCEGTSYWRWQRRDCDTAVLRGVSSLLLLYSGDVITRCADLFLFKFPLSSIPLIPIQFTRGLISDWSILTTSERSEVRFAIKSQFYPVYLILPAALWPGTPNEY
jgi:hypothetical protein